MSRYDDDLKMKLAWQIAYEQRTCPPSEILAASKVDDNLQKHLSFCEVCRENREMTLEEKNAWQGLFKKMSSSIVSANSNTTKQEGQIWSLNKSFGGWQKDGRYFSPPIVLLISQVDESSWKVAQLFGDNRLVGDGDVKLNEGFGFAEGWNCYSLKTDKFEKILGTVTPTQLLEVQTLSNTKHQTATDGSILSFFRNIEREIGAAFGSVALERLKASTEESKELIPGMELLISGAKDYLIDIATDTLGILRGSFKPALVVRGRPVSSSAPKLTKEQKKLIETECFAVPIDVKFSTAEVLITLRWLSKYPIKQYFFQIVVDGTILKDIDMSYSKSGVLRVSSKDYRISEITTHKLANMKLSLSGEVISIALFLDKNETE